MGDSEDWINGLRDQAQKLIGGNALALASAYGPPAGPHDATGQARWSNRMATDVGPIYSSLAGLGHEAVHVGHAVANTLRDPHGSDSFHPGGFTSIPRTVDESVMNMRNNLEGLRAAAEGRAIDPNRLQTEPQPGRLASLLFMPPAHYDGYAPR